MARASLAEFFEEVVAHRAGIACVDRHGYRRRRWNYRELAETSGRLARELEARGIGRGDRVLLWGENGGAWAAAFFGCLRRGAVVVPMDRIAAADFARRVAAQMDARLAVGARALVAQLPGVAALPFDAFEEALAPHPPDYPAPALARDDPAEILFTSGTTAEPKGVVLTHGNLLAAVEPIEGEMRRHPRYLWLERLVHPLRFLLQVPLSHVFGQLLGLLVPPLLGGTVVFQDTLNPAEVERVCRRERVSVLVTVPRLLDTLKAKLERDAETEGRSDDFRRDVEAAAGQPLLRRWWRFRRVRRAFGWKFWAFVCGGATLDAGVETFWRRLGYLVIQGYGLTETAALISVNHPLYLARGSVGRVVPGTEFQLADDGEILVRGPGVAAGYRVGRALEPVAAADGWFHTGDLGERDARGNLFFRGRRKDVIVTPEGMNVHPADLEAALRRQPEVRDAVVVGLPRDANTEPCAVLLLRDAADADAVVRRANRELAPHQQIRRWFVWPDDDFPRTPTQKPRAAAILDFVASRAGQPAPERGPGPPGTLAELLARVTRRPVGTLRPDATLESDLNLSSIERVELLGALEDRFQVELDDARFTAATTVAELEALLLQPAAPGRTAATRVYPRWPQRWPVTWLRVAAWYVLLAPTLWLLARPRFRGREQLPDPSAGPALFISNHVTPADPAFVLAALPARWRHRVAVAMGAERLWGMRNPPAGTRLFSRLLERAQYLLVVALFNVFPLPRRSGFRESFALAGELAADGWSLLVFPEGDLTPDGRLQPFAAGIGILARDLALPVVPVRLDGLYQLKRAGKRRAPPGAVTVTLGAPVKFAAGSEPAAITRELERRLAAL